MAHLAWVSHERAVIAGISEAVTVPVPLQGVGEFDTVVIAVDDAVSIDVWVT